jgi:hypothetical protein
MDAITPIDARETATLQAWLLALLRFAVTLDASDRIVALAAATELDRPNAPQPTPPAHRFFHRTSVSLCTAILEPDVPAGEAALQAHFERIADLRLQRAFAAAVNLKVAKQKPVPKRAAKPGDLWRGLAPRDRALRNEGRRA